MATFLNRTSELSELNAWVAQPGSSMAVVWGRRRVGKTALLQHLCASHRHVFHTGGGTDRATELRRLGEQINGLAENELPVELRDWRDAFEALAALAKDSPLLVVLDEFPSMRDVDPSIDTEIRAAWDRVRSTTNLKVVICGSAVRSMEALQEHRSPLYGRFDRSLRIDPMRPHESALFLPNLKPQDRAIAWGIVGGMPLYLSWWDDTATLSANLARLAGAPGAPLLTEGELVLATDGLANGQARQILFAIAQGRNRVNEIKQTVTNVGERTIVKALDDLESLQLVHRIVPVTDDPLARSGRTSYSITDNFLAFWLTFLAPARGQIERGLGSAALRVVRNGLDDWMGPRWESAVRSHVVRCVEDGSLALPEPASAVGAWWNRTREPIEIDVVVLDDQGRAMLAGEAKWATSVNGAALRASILQRATALPSLHPSLRTLVAARTTVTHADGLEPVTADDVFG